MLLNTIRLALQAMSRNLMRSSLTMLGVVIGVAAVVTIATLGNGASLAISDSVSSLGDRVLFLSPRVRNAGGTGGSAVRQFSMRDVTAIERQINGLEGVAPSVSSGVTAVFGNENWQVNVTGVTESYFPVRNATLIRGSVFDDAQYGSGRLVCIIGATVRDELFGSANPVGAVIRIGKNACPIVGELESKGQSGFGNDQDNVILAPIRAVQSRLRGNTDISQLAISVSTWADMDEVREDIEGLMRERRNVRDGDPDNFQVTDLTQIVGVVSNVTGILTLFLSAIAAISLLVGGIGIMNIMLVSVTERTREIGIRLAIGAMESEVLLQFLVEAVILTTAGGMIGVAIGLAGSFVAANLLDFPFILSPGMIATAFVFSAAIGMIFGYLPARRAASLDPIEALRHE